MTPNLLQIIDPPRPEAIPMLVELPVNAATAPFLVTRASTSNLTMWIDRCRNSKVRAASRAASLENLYAEIVQQVVKRGKEDGWGNSHPLTKAGIEAAIEYVISYGFDDIEVLAHPKTNWADIDPSWSPSPGDMVIGLKGYRVQPAAWLDTTTIVVVPRDREFVGMVFKFEAVLVALVHNAARGMGVATRL